MSCALSSADRVLQAPSGIEGLPAVTFCWVAMLNHARDELIDLYAVREGLRCPQTTLERRTVAYEQARSCGSP